MRCEEVTGKVREAAKAAEGNAPEGVARILAAVVAALEAEDAPKKDNPRAGWRKVGKAWREVAKLAEREARAAEVSG